MHIYIDSPLHWPFFKLQFCEQQSVEEEHEALLPPHELVGDGATPAVVGEEVVGSFERHLRSAFLPPIHKPLQQSVDTLHDSSTKS